MDMPVHHYSATPVLRNGHLLAFTSYLHSMGAPVDRLLQGQKLPTLNNEPNNFVPTVRAWSFFDAASSKEDPLLGWHVGQHMGDHNLNQSLLQKLENEPTLYLALQEFTQLTKIEASDVELGILENPDDILIFTRYPGLRGTPGYHHSQAYQLGIFLGLIRHFLGRQWMPNYIGIESRIIPAGVNGLFPRSRILTQQSSGYIAVPRSRLHEAPPCIKANTGEADELATNHFNFVDTLRLLLRSYLPEGYPPAAFAADLMNVSERTLARRLSAHGMTYGFVVDEVRFKEAKRQMLKPGMKLADIALSVGFDDQGNFTRMFRRIGGLSPLDYRKQIHK